MTAEQKLKLFQDMVLEKNKVMNLTAITDEEAFEKKHMADSLAPLPYFAFTAGDLVADIGTGAGFPGIPLAIMRPDVQFVLMDSVKKKLSFIEEVIQALDLKNVRLIHGRFEDIAQDKKYRETFDHVLSRAVASLPVLFEYAAPLTKVHGLIHSYKSQKVTEELEKAQNAMKRLYLKEEAFYHYTVDDLQHNILTVRKQRKTPTQYPRKAGTPAKNPL